MGVPGKYVAAARHLLGLNQKQLAELSRLHPNSIKRIERMPYAGGYAAQRAVAALNENGIEFRERQILMR